MEIETPETLMDAVRYFADQQVCNEYMRRIKWPDAKPSCPHCGSENIGEVKSRNLIQCRACRKQASYLTGTFMADSRVPLEKWLPAIWASQHGIGSTALAAALGVTQKTAWLMLNKILAAKTEFRPVVGHDGYRVGADGSVWSRWAKGPGARADRAWRKMKTRKDCDGYRLICFRESTPEKIAPIVCEAFHGARPEGAVTRHANGKCDDDRAENLSWGTQQENIDDKRAHGTVAAGEKHGRAKLTNAQIAEVRALKGHAIQREVAKQFGVSRGYVGQLWSGARVRGA